MSNQCQGKKRKSNIDAAMDDSGGGGGSAAAANKAGDAPPLPITSEGTMPQKKYYRSRAHCNPLSFNEAFEYPTCPELMDWVEDHYPEHPLLMTTTQQQQQAAATDADAGVSSAFLSSASNITIQPNVLDIGCGFGGLTLALSNALPHHTILGLEIRTKVTEYVRLRILAQRKEHHHPNNLYQNCSVLRTNAMKYLPNFFTKASIEKIFFCFPDPHFKRKNHPRRIISERLISEYTYLLKPHVGRLYCITDVKDLHLWHVEKCGKHPLLQELTEEEMEEDVCVALMKSETEEGKKVIREGKFGHEMYYRVYRRVGDEGDEQGNNTTTMGKAVDTRTTVRTDGVGSGNVTAESFFAEGQFGVELVNSK